MADSACFSGEAPAHFLRPEDPLLCGHVQDGRRECRRQGIRHREERVDYLMIVVLGLGSLVIGLVIGERLRNRRKPKP